MPKLHFKISLILLAVFALIIYVVYSKTNHSAKPSLTPAQAQLMAIGDKCLDFGERAVANDTPIIEFQMLVRLAKKTHVIEQCMTDNGYQQNPAWLQYAQPIAKANAAKNQSSLSEAFHHLTQSDMQSFNPIKNRPDYWIKK